MKTLSLILTVFFSLVMYFQNYCQEPMPEIPDLPHYLPAGSYNDLSRLRTNLLLRFDALNIKIENFNKKCDYVNENNIALINECRNDNAEIEKEEQQLRDDINNFIKYLDSFTEKSNEIKFVEIKNEYHYKGKYFYPAKNEQTGMYIENKEKEINDTKPHPWDSKWNNYIAEELLKHKEVFLDNPDFENEPLLHDDIKFLYPDFFTASDNEKIAFWTLFIASICVPESHFNTHAQCQETDKETGNHYLSEGLLQLSIQNAAAYHIPLSSATISDPKVNLQSGVVILASQLKHRKQIFYVNNPVGHWSTLNTPSDELLDFFKSHSSSLSGRSSRSK